MKSTFTLSILFCIILFSSCKKDDPVISTESNFKFSFRDNNYKWAFQPDSLLLQKGAMIKKYFDADLNKSVYVLDGWSYPDVVGLSWRIYSDTLAEGRYYKLIPFPNATEPSFIESFLTIKDRKYATHIADHTLILITKKSGKFISGSFSGSVRDMFDQSSTPFNVTNGEFNNIYFQE